MRDENLIAAVKECNLPGISEVVPWRFYCWEPSPSVRDSGRLEFFTESYGSARYGMGTTNWRTGGAMLSGCGFVLSRWWFEARGPRLSLLTLQEYVEAMKRAQVYLAIADRIYYDGPVQAWEGMVVEPPLVIVPYRAIRFSLDQMLLPKRHERLSLEIGAFWEGWLIRSLPLGGEAR